MKARSAWGIDIGTSALKAMRLEPAPDSSAVYMTSCDMVEYPKQLDAPGADSETLIGEAITQFLSRNEVAVGEPVAVNTSGRNALARIVKLPPVQDKRVPEIIAYEARQQIPFCMEDVCWDWQQLLGEDEEGFTMGGEYLIQAIKRDQAERIVQPFTERRVRVRFLQSDPVALLNAVHAEMLQSAILPFNSRDADDALGHLPNTVLVSMGAQSTELVVTDGHRFWSRNIPLGGSHFTKALVKELKLTFAKAEHTKCNATRALDPKTVFAAMRPLFIDLATEIKRSLAFHSATSRVIRYERMLLDGGGTLLPGVKGFLEGELKDKVRSVDTWREWHRMQECDEQMSDGSWPSVRFHVAYGLALQALGEARIQTSLLGNKKRQPFSWNAFFAPLRKLIPRVKISWDR